MTEPTPLSDPDNLWLEVEPEDTDGLTDAEYDVIFGRPGGVTAEVRAALAADDVSPLIEPETLLAAAADDEFHLPGKHNQKTHGQGRHVGTPAESKQFIGEHYGGWERGLTNSEYAGRAFYQSPGFALMNGQRRGQKVDAPAADLKRARKASADWSKAIGKAPPLDEAVIVHRGFSADQFGELKPGMTIRDRGFVSTSLTPGVAPVGAATRPATMEIKLPAGTRAGAGSSRELVLDTASLRVESVGTLGGRPHVVATYVGGA